MLTNVIVKTYIEHIISHIKQSKTAIKYTMSDRQGRKYYKCMVYRYKEQYGG